MNLDQVSGVKKTASKSKTGRNAVEFISTHADSAHVMPQRNRSEPQSRNTKFHREASKAAKMRDEKFLLVAFAASL